MITFLKGTLVESLPKRAIIDVRGVGYEVLIPVSTYDQLPEPGNDVYLLTHFHVREQEQSLYGFSSSEERDLFRLGIKNSDDAFRRASSQLGALVANHLLSAVDAFVSYRLWGGAAIVNSSYLPADGRGRATFNLDVTVGF